MSSATQYPEREVPMVSVIMPVYNQAATLADSVASVQAQRFGDWELHLIDDGSSDASPELIRKLAAEDPRIRPHFHGENRGTAAARNSGIAAACGRYIAFLDADDRWLPAKLERQVAFMRATGAVLSMCAYRIMEEGADAPARDGDASRSDGDLSRSDGDDSRSDGDDSRSDEDAGSAPASPGSPARASRLAGRVIGCPERIGYRGMLRGNAIGCLTAMYDSARIGKVYAPDLRLRQDYALWLEILRPGREALGLNEVLAEYRIAPGSLSSGKARAAAVNWKLLRKVEGLPLHKALWYFGHYAFASLGKYYGRR